MASVIGGIGSPSLTFGGVPRTENTAGAAERVCDEENVLDSGLETNRPRLSLVVNGFEEPATMVPGDELWQEKALCAQTDPEAFFPEKGGSTREAKRICQGCEVRDLCLEYALANDERFGIWGGLSERERRRLKRGIV